MKKEEWWEETYCYMDALKEKELLFSDMEVLPAIVFFKNEELKSEKYRISIPKKIRNHEFYPTFITKIEEMPYQVIVKRIAKYNS